MWQMSERERGRRGGEALLILMIVIISLCHHYHPDLHTIDQEMLLRVIENIRMIGMKESERERKIIRIVLKTKMDPEYRSYCRTK